ncbi:MAG TPA: hypothetical protein VFE32_16950 [Puia sp.]|jgi:hypothetical protein|nr:hypothetical protein [Puia sp.]
MNALYLAVLLTAATPGPKLTATHGSQPVATSAVTGKKDTLVQQFRLRYDHTVLRIPGQSIPVGILTRTAKKVTANTKGYLQGDQGWSKYKVEVQGGSFSNGKIRIAKSTQYQKGDSLTVSVYTRKWFLGGKDKWLLTKKIPYDYEDSISILTTGNIGRAPGGHVQFGIRTWYDNHQFADRWATKKKKLTGFVFAFDGTHLAKSKGDLTIEADPDKISHDQVGLTAMLAKDSVIRDTLRIQLDYIAAYQCKVAAGGDGHDLRVSADVYDDSLIHARLLRIDVSDSVAKKTYHYRVNTNGGSISISSAGGNGLDGRDGLDGASGNPGSDGAVSVDVETTTGPDGTVQTTTNTTQGPGGDGSPGGNGEDGEEGGSGGNGGNIFIRYTPAVTPYLSLIKALSIPGNGGSGGRGGQGGSGGTGGSGNPSGMNGSDGMPGHDGTDGAAGHKGKVVLTAI